MYKNVASQKIAVFAWDTDNETEKTGDAANITAQISKDGGATAATDDTNPTELDATDAPGVYIFDMTQAETNADMITLFAKSSTSNIKIEPVIIYTQEQMRGTDSAATAAEMAKVPKSDSSVSWNATALTAIQTKVNAALVALHLDHLLAEDYDPASKPGTPTALLNEIIENDGGVSRFTQNALEQGPSGSSTAITVNAAGYVGDYNEDDTIYAAWSTITAPTTAGTVKVYRDDGTGEVTVPTGITDDRDFDSKTNLNVVTIDLSANNFYTKGADYSIVLEGAVISGTTINVTIASFSIKNRWAGETFRRDG